PRAAARAAPPAPSRRGSRRPCRPAAACRAGGPSPASGDRPRPAPPPRRARPGATARRPGHGRAAAVRRPRRTAWAARHRSGCRGRRRPRSPRPRAPGPGSRPPLRVRLRLRTVALVVDHAVEHFARADHAQLAARALLDRGLARLEVGHFRRQRRVALLQALVLPRLLRHSRLELLHRAGPALAEPEAVL